jgi:hypothetical protein
MSEIVLMQTSDAKRYLPILQATAAVNQTYCARHNISYSQFVGIKRGFHPWHACFNRILLIKEMIDSGFKGWVFYLDADAFVADPSYDVRHLISNIAKPIIMAPGGLTGELWDVNSGVFLVDLDNEIGRDLIMAWHADFMTTSEDVLRTAAEWEDVDSDQPRLHGILQRVDRFRSSLGIAHRQVLNDSEATFVRQILRCHPGTWEDRLAEIRKETASVLERACDAGRDRSLPARKSSIAQCKASS